MSIRCRVRGVWGVTTLVVLAGSAGAFSAHASSGADALLQSVSAPKASAAQGAAGVGKAAQVGSPSALESSAGMAGIQLDDPFRMQLFASWQMQNHQLGYDLSTWVLRVLKNDFEGAAHLWTKIEGSVPQAFAHEARSAWLYSLWKLDLAQSFVDQWIDSQNSKGYASSRAAGALDQVLAQAGLDRWLSERAVALSPEQEASVKRLDTARGLHVLTLQAWGQLRQGEGALPTLKKLPLEHGLRPALAQTVALARARRGDLAGAAQVLKHELEPVLEARGDALALSAHHLQVARLLYQAGALDGAEDYYRRVPAGAPQFLKAREELTWTLLRKNEVGKLRGELATLSTGVFTETFQPEVFLVRAISNLKLCYYEEVRKDFSAFQSVNGQWAKKIDQALQAGAPPRPEWVDEFGLRAEKSFQARSIEAARLSELAKVSIQAVLPAVGEQKHWVRLRDRMLQARDRLAQNRDAEFRRQWLSRRQVLEEAIRKMAFVKVELGSQLRELSRLENRGQVADSVQSSAAAALKQAAPQVPRASAGAVQVYPQDGELWPDELFRLQSVARERCLALQGGGSQ